MVLENGPDNNDARNGEREPPVSHHTTHFMGAVALIPQFSGTDTGVSVKDFVRAVQAAGKLTNCNDNQLAEIAKLKFTTLANDFLEAHPDLENATWTQLSKELLTRFGDNEDPQEKRYALKDCVQKPSESVRDYLTRLRQLGHKTIKQTDDLTEKRIRTEIMEDELLSQFLRGLKLDLQHPTYSSRPKTLNQAADFAAREEKFHQANPANTKAIVCAIPSAPTPAPRVRDSRRSAYERDHRDTKRSLSNKFSSNRSPYRQPNSRSTERSSQNNSDRRRNYYDKSGSASGRETRCYNCNQPNHIARHCTLPTKDGRTPRNRSQTPYRNPDQDRRTPSNDRRSTSGQRDRSSSRDRYYDRQRTPSRDRNYRTPSRDRNYRTPSRERNYRSESRDRYPNARGSSQDRR